MNMLSRDCPTSDLFEGLDTHLSPEQLERLRATANTYGEALLHLRRTPAEEILTQEQIEILARVEAEPLDGERLPHSSLVIILKATRLCNLRCSYCNSWRSGPDQVMDFETLARLFRTTLLSPGLRHLQVVWHGGEVTLLKPEQALAVLWLQERYRKPATMVENCIQTNGTRLSPEWVAFLKSYRIAVGVSIDATPELHDARRKTKAGRGSWQSVHKGIDALREAGLPFGILAVIDEHALQQGASDFLAGLAGLGAQGIAVLNALPANEGDRPNSNAYLDWDRYVAFLREMFAIWWTDYRGSFDIRELSALVDALEGRKHGLCIYADNCMGRYVTVEPDGRLSACEKYVGNPDYAFGKLGRQSVANAFARSSTLKQAVQTVERQKESTRSCKYYSICNGGCPHDDLNNQRFAAGQGGCCGLSDLVSDIEMAIQREGV